MPKSIVLALALCATIITACYSQIVVSGQQWTAAQIIALAPVQSVNTGTVTVPTLCRQQSTALAIPTSNPGNITWTFPNANCTYATAPTCWASIASSASTAAFDKELTTAASTTSITMAFTAHASTLTIAILGVGVAVTTGPPSGSTATITYTGAPA